MRLAARKAPAVAGKGKDGDETGLGGARVAGAGGAERRIFSAPT